MTFSEALELMKDGKETTREVWNKNITVKVQYPDGNSKMTKPYLYAIKGTDNFPLDLSTESIFAEDWMVV